MKWKLTVALLSVIVIIACSKDKYQTRPTIRIKSLNTEVLPAGADNDLSIVIEYTDKQGDLGDDTLVSIRNRLNRRALPPGRANADTLFNVIPDFPNKSKGDFEVRFNWATYLHQSDIENDTILFKFVAKDRGGNISDTVSTTKIVILRQ